MHCRCNSALILIIFILSGVLSINQAAALEAEDAPDTVAISTLADLYEPVEFDHSMHVDLAECVECHHHTTGQQPAQDECLKCHANSKETDSISCADCHTAKRFYPEDLQHRDTDIYHIDKPGLKGAYHLNCVGCHSENDGPIGCEDCHAMNEKGKHRFRTSIIPPTNGKEATEHK